MESAFARPSARRGSSEALTYLDAVEAGSGLFWMISKSPLHEAKTVMANNAKNLNELFIMFSFKVRPQITPFSAHSAEWVSVFQIKFNGSSGMKPVLWLFFNETWGIIRLLYLCLLA
jgi:hypothetical protein